MNRFFLPENCFYEKKVVFPPEIIHQIFHVLRLRESDVIQVLDNQGFIHQVVLVMDKDEDSVSGVIMQTDRDMTEPRVEISLCFGMTSRDKVEWILQKGTEIGVAAFYPFVSSRTLVTSTELNMQRKSRWQRIIREAAEQSHRGRLPELKSPLKLANCFTVMNETHDLCLLAWEGVPPSWEGRTPMRETLRQAVDEVKPASIALFIGPEGGFAVEEVDLARDAGCKIISLGPRILRMETAAIVFPALVLYELQDDHPDRNLSMI